MYDSVLGAPAVKQQLSEVVGNWKKSRLRINGELEALVKLAEAAAAQYAATEGEISRAFSSGGQTSTGGNPDG